MTNTIYKQRDSYKAIIEFPKNSHCHK